MWICGGQTDTGTGFSLNTPVSPVSIFPPVVHTHLSIAGCTCCQQLTVSLCSRLILKNRNIVFSLFVWTVQELSQWYQWWWWWLFTNLMYYRPVFLCNLLYHTYCSLMSHPQTAFRGTWPRRFSYSHFLLSLITPQKVTQFLC
jgi:hypothetical protein